MEFFVQALKNCWKALKVSTKNSKDLLNANNKSSIIGSMDITSLYPSLKVEKCADIIREEVNKSRTTFENIDMYETEIYLSKNLSSVDMSIW